MQIRSRRAPNLLCVPLLLLAAGCTATQPAPPASEAPRFALGSKETPRLTASEPATATAPAPSPEAPLALAPPVSEAPWLEPLDPTPWPLTPAGRAAPVKRQGNEHWRVNRPPDNNFMFLLGVRDLSNTDWEGVDSIPDIGFTQDSKLFGKHFSVDFGIHYAASGNKFVSETQTQASSEVWEWDLGLLKRFAINGGIWQPYVGAGVALVRAAGTVPAPTNLPRDYAWSFGGYVRAGMALALSEGGMVGIDARYLGLTDVELSGVSTDVNGPTLSLFFGVGW